MTIKPLNAGFPSGPVASTDSGEITPAWRGLLVALYERTGQSQGVSTDGLTAAIAVEATARQHGDDGLTTQITNEANARQAADNSEAAARGNADIALNLTKMSRSGDTMSGPLTVLASGTFDSVQIGGTLGPTWTTGTAVPTDTAPVGSLYSRVGGAVGSTLYVSRGGGTWIAVAGV